MVQNSKPTPIPMERRYANVKEIPHIIVSAKDSTTLKMLL
jgi:hypothetical protein